MAERAYTYFVIQYSKFGEAKPWGLTAMGLLICQGRRQPVHPDQWF
jgi:hypothetical protein